jgi:hypothetical protein
MRQADGIIGCKLNELGPEAVRFPSYTPFFHNLNGTVEALCERVGLLAILIPGRRIDPVQIIDPLRHG